MSNISNINVIAPNAAANAADARTKVVAAIKDASARSGVDFAYMLNQASQESGLNPTAKAAGSSATGLYQFIDQTWLKTVKASGDKYGLSAMADKITIDSRGHASVADAADKKAILALRSDPTVASQMAAELAKANQQALTNSVGGKVGATEMYMAHFLGSGGASTFLSALKSNPNAKAADILPAAAAANTSVFYDSKTGAAKTVSQIYQKFAAKFDAGSTGAAATRLASLDAKTPSAPISTALLGSGDAALASALSGGASGVSTAGVGGRSLMGSYSKNGVTMDGAATSQFATMILAQMDMQTFGIDAMADAHKMDLGSDETRKKSVLATLAQAA